MKKIMILSVAIFCFVCMLDISAEDNTNKMLRETNEMMLETIKTLEETNQTLIDINSKLKDSNKKLNNVQENSETITLLLVASLIIIFITFLASLYITYEV